MSKSSGKIAVIVTCERPDSCRKQERSPYCKSCEMKARWRAGIYGQRGSMDKPVLRYDNIRPIDPRRAEAVRATVDDAAKLSRSDDGGDAA